MANKVLRIGLVGAVRSRFTFGVFGDFFEVFFEAVDVALMRVTFVAFALVATSLPSFFFCQIK